MAKIQYESYDDWYDNGPGSEKFKRECRLLPTLKGKVLKEEVNEWDKTITVTIRLPLYQWNKFKQVFIGLLHKMRRA